MSVVYIVRHGQASLASANYDRLSELGERQAALLADYFVANQLFFDAVYSGSLVRQVNTALPVLERQPNAEKKLELVQHEGFNEFDFRPVLKAYLKYLAVTQPDKSVDLDKILLDKPAFQRLYDAAMHVWITGELSDPPMESWLDFKERVVSAFCQLITESRGTVLLSTSAGVIGVILQHVLGCPDRQAISLSYQVCNSALNKVYFNRQGDISVGMFNAIPHLEQLERRSMISYR
jgi:broad specificity phosphatase PhoE